MAKKTRKSSAVKAAETEAAKLRKNARELAKKAGKSVSQVRKEVAALKKAGLVSTKIDPRTYQPSRYMLNKLRRNADIISGKAVAVKAPKDVRQKYTEKGVFEERGDRLIVPKDYEDQKTGISRGMVEVRRKLKMGDERRIYLPFKATDMQDVATRLQTDPSLDGLKHPDELFGFRMFGHNMGTFGFPDAEMLGDYILRNYQHLFKGNNRSTGVSHFQLLRFRARDSRLPEGPDEDKEYSAPKKPRVVQDWLYKKRLRKDAARKRREREHETPEQRALRLEKQKRRQAILRQRRFEEK